MTAQQDSKRFKEKHPNYFKEYNKKYWPKYFDKLHFGGNKKLVLERDNYKCTFCNISQDEHYVLFNIKLCVHHKDSNKKNNQIDNLVTLCRKCHSNLHANNREKKERDMSKRFMMEMRKFGCTYAEIGKRAGISRQRVHQILNT